MSRKARISRTKAVFARKRKATDVSHREPEVTSHENTTLSMPSALQTLLRKPLQISQAKKSRRNKRKNRSRQQAVSNLSSLLQQRIMGNNHWAGNKIHPIALLAWLAAEEPINSDFLIENAALLAEGSAEDIDPVFATQLDDVISRFVNAGITDVPSSQENPLVEVPKDFSMSLTIFGPTDTPDHDALMAKYDLKMNNSKKIVGIADPVKTTKHPGFDPVQVLKKHAITLRGPVVLPNNTLTSPIHVLFREENFHGCPQHIYEVLKPGLRLASLILTHRATSTFWHTVMFGRREFFSTVPYVIKIVDDILWTEENEQKYHQHLARVADSVHFQFSLWMTVNNETEHTYGSMHPIEDLRLGWLPNPADPCRKSRIRLHTDFYTTAKRLSLLRNPDPLMVLRFNLLLASVLCHELAHFLEMSSNDTLRKTLYDGMKKVDVVGSPEPIMNGHTFAEMGMAFETKVFGGRLEPISCRIDCAYGLTTYTYDEDMNTPHSSRTFYTVPMDYVYMLQQQETWEQDLTGKDWKIFHIPRDGATAVSIPYFNMTVWEGEDEGKQVSDVLDLEGTPFRRTFDSRIIKANRGVKSNH